MIKKLLSLLVVALCLVSLAHVHADDKGTTVNYTVRATITLTYPNGDEVIIKVKVDDPIPEPSHPDIPGKEFDGWYDKDTDEKWNFDDPVKGDMELEARYTGDKDTWTITILDEDDQVVGTLEVPKGTVIDEPSHDDKDGYRFAGFEDEDGNIVDFTKPITEDKKIKPKYIKTYEVKIYYDDTDIRTQIIDESGKATDPGHKEKAHYDFKGYYNGDEKWNFNTPVMGDIVLKPKYELHKHTVTLKDEGTTTTVQVEYGKSLTEPTPKGKEGYVFDGWYLGNNKWDFENPITADVTLIAKYVKKYKITIEDGTTTTTIEIKEGDKIPEPTHPDKPGYEFDGWYDKKSGKKWNFNDPVTGDLELVVKYKKIYDITIDNGKKTYKIQVVEGNKIKEPEHATIDDYKFIGWYDDSTGKKWNFNDPVSKELKLIAKYEKMSEAEKKAREFIETGSGNNALMALVGLCGSFVYLLYMRKKEDE